MMLTKLFPRTCVLCHNRSNSDMDLCQACYDDLPIIPHACQQCGIATPVTVAQCGQCLVKQPRFRYTIAPFQYAFPIDYFISQLKFRRRLIYAKLLSQCLLPYIKNYYHQYPPLPEVVIAIPLHPSRLRQRGFNQALEIAKPLAKALHIPLDITTCRRHLPTQPQSDLPAKKRLANVRRAFLAEALPARHIAVLDDVVTTGSTMLACTQALAHSTSQRIDVWAVARPKIPL